MLNHDTSQQVHSQLTKSSISVQNLRLHQKCNQDVPGMNHNETLRIQTKSSIKESQNPLISSRDPTLKNPAWQRTSVPSMACGKQACCTWGKESEGDRVWLIHCIFGNLPSLQIKVILKVGLGILLFGNPPTWLGLRKSLKLMGEHRAPPSGTSEGCSKPQSTVAWLRFPSHGSKPWNTFVASQSYQHPSYLGKWTSVLLHDLFLWENENMYINKQININIYIYMCVYLFCVSAGLACQNHFRTYLYDPVWIGSPHQVSPAGFILS